MSLVFFINAVAFGVGLAMDAFSVSLANGLNDPRMSTLKMSKIAGIFAAFQTAMPLIGWLCVHTVANLFSSFEKAIPWIALILLCYIGGKMLIEGLKSSKENSEDTDSSLGLSELLVQGIATSIDALSVGFTIANHNWIDALVESVIIGVVTFFICVSGLYIGKRFGTKLSNKASVLGGLILIVIGIEIFVTGIGA